MSGSCPRLRLGPRLDMIICWRNVSPAFVVGAGRVPWSPVPPQPHSFLESNGATWETCLRDLESLAPSCQHSLALSQRGGPCPGNHAVRAPVQRGGPRPGNHAVRASVLSDESSFLGGWGMALLCVHVSSTCFCQGSHIIFFALPSRPRGQALLPHLRSP